MAYNVDNWGVIESGATIGVGFLINGGQGAGSQWAQGAPQDAGNACRQSKDNRRFDHDDDHREPPFFALSMSLDSRPSSSSDNFTPPPRSSSLALLRT